MSDLKKVTVEIHDKESEDNEIEAIIKQGLENLQLDEDIGNEEDNESNAIDKSSTIININQENIFSCKSKDTPKLESSSKSIALGLSSKSKMGKDGNEVSLEYNLSNINTPDLRNFLSPNDMVKSLESKKKIIEEKQKKYSYLKRVVKGEKSSSSGSIKEYKKKKNKSQENFHEEEIAIFFDKDLTESDFELKYTHLKSYSGNFKSIVCTQIGSRCLQKSFGYTQPQVLDSLVESEVRFIFINIVYEQYKLYFNR